MKDRLLNFLLITFVLLLAMNLFLPSPKKVVESNDPAFVLSKAAVVVPNYPVVTFKNPTDSAIAFNTCSDLAILKDLKTVSIDAAAQAFCKDVKVAPKSEQALDISELTALFNQPGSVGFKLVSGGKEITANVTVEERSWIRTLMATVFYAPILNFFVGIIQYLPGHSLGIAIVIITIVVRLILLVPQHQMMISTKRMQEIQPKVKELQNKHKSDQAKMGMELMELYKQEKVNPLGSCLPLLIQTPILLVLYWVLSSIQDHSNYFYLYPIFQSFDVSKLDHIFLGMDLLAIGGVTAAILGVVVGVTQFLQIWLSQRRAVPLPEVKPEDRDPNSIMPDPQMMNKFMLYVLPVVIAVSVLYFPIGVGIYWFIGTLFMLVQQAIVNHMLDSEKEKGEIIVPAGSSKKQKNSKKDVVIEG
jgi:YidC/Oxa1 family membrane protein insertase